MTFPRARSRTRSIAVAALTCAVLLAPADPAAASQFIDRGATGASLSVTPAGALVTYRAGGVTRRVLARERSTRARRTGACRRSSSASQPARRFRAAAAAATTARACGGSSPRARPPTAPTGRCRAGPACCRTSVRGPRASSSRRVSCASHWRGPIAELEIETDWAWRRFDHLYGRLTYLGKPVPGFAPRATGRRSTPTAATSTSTPSTHATAAAGSGRTASSRTARQESSVTWCDREGSASATGPRSSDRE